MMTAGLAVPVRAQWAAPNTVSTPYQNQMVVTRPVVEAPTPNPAVVQPEVVQTGCSTCGSGLFGGHGGHFGGCGSGCGAGCYPGREPCQGCFPDTFCGRVFGGLYECICCPDPCYEPQWIAAANAAFFVDAARPVTQMRLRADWAFDFDFPDRAEYLWARIRTAQTPLLATGEPCRGNGNAKGPQCDRGERSVDYREFSYYMEAATGRFSVFTEVPYHRVEGDICPCDFSGFGDMNIGTKSLLLDCELLQIAFQFRTYIPTGAASKGLGNGHVSLEPSLLWALRLAPDKYLQAQTSYWIPINGDELYAGDIFHYHVSLNCVLYRPVPDVQLIGTAELNGWSVLDGLYTDPNFGGPAPLAVKARTHIMSAGPGLRFVICDKIDLGFAAAFALTSEDFSDEFYRAEFRWRF
jgi:hypothetical protein